MKLALVCLLASQALAFPSSSEEDISMRSLSSSEEEEIDMGGGMDMFGGDGGGDDY